MKILLSRPDRIGDVIISSPIIRGLQEAYPDMKIHLLADEKLNDLFYKHPRLSSFVGISRNIEVLKGKLQALQADIVLHLNPHPEIEELCAEIQIPIRAGFYIKDKQYLTHPLPFLKQKAKRHESEYSLDLCNAVKLSGIQLKREADLSLNPDAKENVQRLLEKPKTPYAVLHLGVFGKKPRIPTSYFVEISEYFIRKRKLQIILIGQDKKDKQLTEYLKATSSLNNKVLNLYGQTSIAMTAWILADAQFYFSRDTGPAHLSAAVNCPTTTLFLQPNPVMSPRRWHPLGRKSFSIARDIKQRFWESDHAFAKRHLKMITTDEIIQTIEKAMDS